MFQLPDTTTIYPGHDYNGRTATSIGEEKALNPYFSNVSEEEFVQIMGELNLPKPKKIDIAVSSNMACGLDKVA